MAFHIQHRAKKNRRILEQGWFQAQICHNNPFLTSRTGSPNKCDTKTFRGCVTRPGLAGHTKGFFCSFTRYSGSQAACHGKVWEAVGEGGTQQVVHIRLPVCATGEPFSAVPRPRDAGAAGGKGSRPAFLPTRGAKHLAGDMLGSHRKSSWRALCLRGRVLRSLRAPEQRDSAGRGGAAGAEPGFLRSGSSAECERRASERGCSGRHGEHRLGDHRVHRVYLGLAAGVFHGAHRLLEGIHQRRHGHHHRHLLGQPVEDMRYGLHRGLQLQGLPLHAGAGRSASPGPCPATLPLVRPADGAPARLRDPRWDLGWGRADSSEIGPSFPLGPQGAGASPRFRRSPPLDVDPAWAPMGAREPGLGVGVGRGTRRQA